AMLINYLIPGFALFYGAVILGEPVTDAKLVGLALILVGVTLASGVVVRRRRGVSRSAERAQERAAAAARSSSSWRSSMRRIFPVSVLGRSGSNSTRRG